MLANSSRLASPKSFAGSCAIRFAPASSTIGQRSAPAVLFRICPVGLIAIGALSIPLDIIFPIALRLQKRLCAKTSHTYLSAKSGVAFSVQNRLQEDRSLE